MSGGRAGMTGYLDTYKQIPNVPELEETAKKSVGGSYRTLSDAIKSSGTSQITGKIVKVTF